MAQRLLSCGPSVGLPGIEPAALQGIMPSDLQVHSVSVRFSPARYLRFCSRVLTASSVKTQQENQPCLDTKSLA